MCQNSAKIVRTVRKYTQKYITTVTSISVPTNVVWQPWNACQYSQKLQLLSSSISVHITCCMTSTNPYGTACSSLLSAASKSVLLFALGCVLSFSKCCLFSSARPLSCSLLFSQQECLTTQEWVRPLALVDLMREGEGFSNLTVEIRLDGWLRFGVSSLTLSLIIKSPFNLHLTN